MKHCTWDIYLLFAELFNHSIQSDMKKIILGLLAFLTLNLNGFAQEFSSPVKGKLVLGISNGISTPQGDFAADHLEAFSAASLAPLLSGNILNADFTGLFSLEDFLKNSFAEQGNHFSVFGEYYLNENFGVFGHWTHASYDLKDTEILETVDQIGDLILPSTGLENASIDMRLTDGWKADQFLLGSVFRQQYTYMSIYAKAGVGLVKLESPGLNSNLNFTVLGISLSPELLKIEQESNTSFAYQLGLGAQFDLNSNWGLRASMDYTNAQVEYEGVAAELPIDQLLPLLGDQFEIPTEITEPDDITVDFQTLNYSLSLVYKF